MLAVDVIEHLFGCGEFGPPQAGVREFGSFQRNPLSRDCGSKLHSRIIVSTVASQRPISGLRGAIAASGPVGVIDSYSYSGSRLSIAVAPSLSEGLSVSVRARILILLYKMISMSDIKSELGRFGRRFSGTSVDCGRQLHPTLDVAHSTGMLNIAFDLLLPCLALLDLVNVLCGITSLYSTL